MGGGGVMLVQCPGGIMSSPLVSCCSFARLQDGVPACVVCAATVDGVGVGVCEWGCMAG